MPTTVDEVQELADETLADLTAIADQIFNRPPTEPATGTSRPPTDTTTGTGRPDVVVCGAPVVLPTPTTIPIPTTIAIPPTTAPPTTAPPVGTRLAVGDGVGPGGAMTGGTGGAALDGTGVSPCPPDDDADAPLEPVEIVTLAPVATEAPTVAVVPTAVTVAPVDPVIDPPIEDPPLPPPPDPPEPPPLPPVLAFVAVTLPTVPPVIPFVPAVAVLDLPPPPEVSPRLVPPEVRPPPAPSLGSLARPLVVRGIGPGRPSALPGGLAEASGLDCPAGSAVTLRVEGREVGRTTANAAGGFQAQLSLPSDLQVGRKQVSAICGPVTLEGPLQLVQTSSNLNAGAGITTLAALLSLFMLIVLVLRNTEDDRRPTTRTVDT